MYLYFNVFVNEGSMFFIECVVFIVYGCLCGNVSLKKGQWGWIDFNSVCQVDIDLKYSFVQLDYGLVIDCSVVCIDLVQLVLVGGMLMLDIDFFSQLLWVVECIGWFGDFNLVGQWFLKIGVLELLGECGVIEVCWNCYEFYFNSEFYVDFGLYDVKFMVLLDYIVGVVGELQGQLQSEGGKIIYYFVQGDVYDFVWVVVKGYKMLDGMYEGFGSLKVVVWVIYLFEYEVSVKLVFKVSIDLLGYFFQMLGVYLYKMFIVVVLLYNVSEVGGMEYFMFFIVEGYSVVDLGMISQYVIDFVIIYEFGYGYFYGLFVLNEFEELMLDEGFNEYWDQCMLCECKQGFDLFMLLMNWLGVMFLMDGFIQECFIVSLCQLVDLIGENVWDCLFLFSYGMVYLCIVMVMYDLEE